MRFKTVSILLACAVLTAAPAGAKEEPAKKLTLAVLDFAAGGKEAQKAAESVPDLLEASLATAPGLRLVTRRELRAIQKEQGLNLAGLVKAGEGARVGKIVGADILVIGRVTLVDDELIVLGKAIGSETGVFLPAVVRGKFDAKISKLVEQLGKRLAGLLEERSEELLPLPDGKRREEIRIRKKLAKREAKLPTVGVVVFEDHVRSTDDSDPAAETEILAVLKRLGFPLRELSGRDVRAWLTRFQKDEVNFSEKHPVRVDVVIVGRGFSEFAGRVGEFVSCKARLEVRAIRVSDGSIVGVSRGITAAADLSEIFAGKKALQELGYRAALELALKVAGAKDPR